MNFQDAKACLNHLKIPVHVKILKLCMHVHLMASS
jgi:hypothetical protein